MQGSPETSRCRLVASFEGRVQGVGFRFTTQQIARDYQVTGYVQNMMDGSVRLVAEGADDEVKRFLEDVRSSHIFRHVIRENLDWQAASGDMSKFEVRYA